MLLDLDGTVYRGNAALENIEILNNILKEKTVTFLTNSGTKTSGDVRRKLSGLGYCTSDFHCYTALQHLRDTLIPLGNDHDIYCISNREVRVAVGCEEPFFNTLTIERAFETLRNGRCAQTIVAFFVDTIENLDLDAIVTATSIIVSNGGHAYFSAGDSVVPTCKNGRYVNHPGPGSVIAMLRSVLSDKDKRHIHVLGKGGDTTFMERAFEIAKAAYYARPSNSSAPCAWKDVIVVGDNPMTDIAGGLQMGARTVLVDTGMKNEHHRLFYNRPHLLANTLGGLVESDQPSTIGLDYLVDVLARKALNLHKCVNDIANNSLSYCLDSISSAPIRKTQSLPCRLDAIDGRNG